MQRLPPPPVPRAPKKAAAVPPLPQPVLAPPPPPSQGEARLRRALVAPPKENLRKYGFQTATAIENLKPKPPPVYHGPSATGLKTAKLPPMQSKPYFPGQKVATHSSTGTPIYFDPRRNPDQEALTWQNMLQAGGGQFGRDIAKASNPRVATLEAVLGGLAPIAPIVGAVRKGNILSAGVQAAALFTPVGKLGEIAGAIRAGEDVSSIVKTARAVGYIKGDGRDAFGLAIREAAPDKRAAAQAIAQADAIVHQHIMSLPVGERAVAAQELFDQLRRTVPSRPIPKFEYPSSTAEEQANLRSIMKPGNVQPPKNARLPSMHPDAVSTTAPGGHQVVGDLNRPEDWWWRTQHSVGYDPTLPATHPTNVAAAKTGLKLANWYAEMGPMFQHFFGEDANSILRGFAVSQANASPASGLTNVLRVRDMLLRNEPIPADEISTVVKSIEQAVKGEPVTSGMKAKLKDFSDALQGKTTRTWTGNDIRGGQPTPIDIHALRDLGFIDKKILKTLQERHGLPVAHLRLQAMESELTRLKTAPLRKGETAVKRAAKLQGQERRVAAFKKTNADAIKAGKRSGLTVDSSGNATTRQYNYGVVKYQQFTDYLNGIKAWGKSDWTPAEVQALGWSAVQRFHGTVPEDAKFMMDRNTTSIAFEVLNGQTGIGDRLSPAAQYAVTRDVAEEMVPKALAAEGIIPRSEIRFGLGGWENAVSPAAYVQVFASPEQVDRVVARLANMFDQYDVWGVRTGVTVSKREGAGFGRAALEIAHDQFKDPVVVEAYWKALRARIPEKMQEHFKGFSSFMREDPITGEQTPGIRIITEARPVTKAQSGRFGDSFESFVMDAAHDVGVTDGLLHYNTTNVEVRDAVHAQARTRGAPRVSKRGRVGDPLAAEAQQRLADAVDQYAGQAQALRRELPSGGQPHPGVSFHDPHGLEQGLPVHFPPERPRAVAPAETPPVEPAAPTVYEPSNIRAARSVGPYGPHTLDAAVEEALAGTPAAYREQRGTYSAENARRIGDYSLASQADPTAAGHAAAKTFLAGKYPVVRWGKFEEFTPEAADAMHKWIVDHPQLSDWEKVRARDAIDKVRSGVTPTFGEQQLLRKAFGIDTTRQMLQSVSWFHRAKAHLFDVLNIPRALQASMDVSGLFRQGLLMATSHPVITGKNVPDMLKAFASEKFYQQKMDALHADPFVTTGRADQMGIDFTELGQKGDLSQPGTTGVREESFPSPIAEKIPGVRMSGRAYTYFLDKTRLDLAKYLDQQVARKTGKEITRIKYRDGKPWKPYTVKEKIDPEDPQLLQSIGSFVNSASGRGDLGQGVIGSSADAVNLLLFSPRLMKSRIDFLNPRWYARLHPVARHQAYRAMSGLMVSVATALSIADALGAKLNLDPRSADFGKIKVGDTRIDLAGGFLPYMRLLSELATQQTVSSSTGKTTNLAGPLRAPSFGAASDWSVALNFLRSKFAPIPSAVADVSQGASTVGQSIRQSTMIPFVPDSVASRFLPLVGQDAYSVYQQTLKSTGSQEKAIAAAIGLYGLGATGVGVQSYPPKPPKAPAGAWVIPSGGPSSAWKMP